MYIFINFGLLAFKHVIFTLFEWKLIFNFLVYNSLALPYNISYKCLFVYINFPPFSEILQCLNAIVFIPMLLRNISN